MNLIPVYLEDDKELRIPNLWRYAYFSVGGIPKEDTYRRIKNMLKNGADIDKGCYKEVTCQPKTQLLGCVRDINIMKILLEKEVKTRYPDDIGLLNSPEGDEILEFFMKDGKRQIFRDGFSIKNIFTEKFIDNTICTNKAIVDHLTYEYRNYDKLFYFLEKPGELERKIENGWNVNFKGYYGNTVLHFHVRKSEIRNYLLAKGADPNVKNDHGQSSMHNFLFQSLYMERDKNVEEFKESFNIFLKYGGDVNSQDNNGETAVHRVADYGIDKQYNECLRIVLQHADIDIENNEGESARQYKEIRNLYKEVK